MDDNIQEFAKHEESLKDEEDEIDAIVNADPHPDWKYKVIPYDGHPNQCQGKMKSGQCHYLSVEGCVYCPRHGGTVGLAIAKKKELAMYKIKQWEQRLAELGESPKVKSLREEINITRLTLENIANQCTTNNDFVIHSHRISNLVTTIEKLLSTADRLEMKMNLFLDKSAALSFSSQIIDIISLHVQNPDIVEKISSDIIKALDTLTGNRC